MSEGCTLAAKIIGPRYFMVKNRDLVYPDFQSYALFDDTIFAVTGVHIGSGEPMGVSIGVNRWGLSVCSSTVLANTDTAYDMLLERVLRKCKTIDEAAELVRADLQSGNRYQWSNFLLATADEVGAIEIGDGVMEIEKLPEMITRANHHLKLSTVETLKASSPEEREAGGPIQDSQHRRQVASKMLESAVSIGDMMEIVCTHSDSRGYDSICRHWSSNPDNPLLGETSYSYILEVLKTNSNAFDIRMHAARGNPCSNTFREILLDFAASPSDKQELVQSFP
ncbi:MAG: carcinine hydrolase/isopenicillin-N N-acyltransferase family protein [Candidatus Thorarchaeota archaeon]